MEKLVEYPVPWIAPNFNFNDTLLHPTTRIDQLAHAPYELQINHPLPSEHTVLSFPNWNVLIDSEGEARSSLLLDSEKQRIVNSLCARKALRSPSGALLS
jgi:hypothetical protein